MQNFRRQKGGLWEMRKWCKEEICQGRCRGGGLGNFGKLTLPLLSRLARRERFCLQGRIKGLENFPGDRIAGFQCHAIQNRSK